MLENLKREIIPFTTEEKWLELRTHDLTSSDIATLFNVGYTTYKQLLEAKLHGKKIEVEENERMQWGVALQDSIAVEFAKRNKWTIRKKSEYVRLPLLRIGSSFDFEIGSVQESAHSLLEIKNVSIESYKTWLKGFQIEMSPYIELQVQHQMLVSGLNKCIVGALIAGCEGKLIKRDADKKIQDAILFKCKRFWEAVDNAK